MGDYKKPSGVSLWFFYIPPDRSSIALEPMTCKANAFNNGDGLITLAPGESFEGSFGVYVN